MNFSWRKKMSKFAVCLAMASATSALLLASPVYAQALGPFFGFDDQEDDREQRVQLLPDDFFASFPTAAAQNIAVEADSLVFDADNNQILAEGNVQLSFNGYLASADRAVYDRSSGDLTLIGNAVVRDPEQVVYTGERFDVTGDFKQAFVHALEMQTSDGALITADEADYRNGVEAILENGSYAPCGFCTDEHGHKIGWRVKAAKIVLNQEEQTLYMESPELELLGHSVAWIPFLWMPDPTNARAAGFRFPNFDYSEDFGGRVAVPYFHPLGPDTDLWLTPMLMSQQIFMMDAEITHRFEQGSATVRAAGLYQFDSSVFAGQVGDRDWRGAIQISGKFAPAENWAAGWSYLAFTDPAFIPNYQLSGFDTIDDIYVQHLGANTFFDARVQKFNALGNVLAPIQDRQGMTLPVARLDHVEELADGMGQVAIEADLIGVSRAADHTTTKTGVPYVYGYEGNKVHGSVEAVWSKQWIAPGGVVVTPYLGLRGDAANYDGASALLGASSLFSLTPIAALDVRLPFIGYDGANTHLLEPILQMSYRGSNTTLPGITNDNAHGFIFEDSNLFSFNRFSGNDRQETGLRLNVGGQYLANFADGSWLRFIGGQSFHLAGVNSFSIFDHGQVGNSSGLNGTNSFLVAGAQASFEPGIGLGGKIEYDTATSLIVRGAVAAELGIYDFTLSADYFYLAPKLARGETSTTHTLSANVGIPVAEYWTINAGGSFNLVANDWSNATIGAVYDDQFLTFGASYTATHTVSTPIIKHKWLVSYGLKGLTD